MKVVSLSPKNNASSLDVYLIYMFTVMAEIDSVEVQPPSPMRYDFDKPPIVFSRAGPEDDALPGVPFVFNRTGAGLDPNRFFPDEKCIPIPWP